MYEAHEAPGLLPGPGHFPVPFHHGGGFVVVDYQGRRLSFGESQPPLWLRRLPGGRYTLEVDLLGVEASLDATGLGRARDFLLDFLCLPHS